MRDGDEETLAATIAEARAGLAQADRDTASLADRLAELKAAAPRREEFPIASIWRLARRIHRAGCNDLAQDIADRRRAAEYFRGVLDLIDADHPAGTLQ